MKPIEAQRLDNEVGRIYGQQLKERRQLLSVPLMEIGACKGISSEKAALQVSQPWNRAKRSFLGTIEIDDNDGSLATKGDREKSKTRYAFPKTDGQWQPEEAGDISTVGEERSTNFSNPASLLKQSFEFEERREKGRKESEASVGRANCWRSGRDKSINMNILSNGLGLGPNWIGQIWSKLMGFD